MTNYKLNYPLLRDFMQIMGLTHKKFQETTGFRYSLMYYWVAVHDIPINRLVSLCNSFRVPISHFIIPETETVELHDKDYYVVPAKEYKPVDYNFSLVSIDLTVRRRMTVREICAYVNCSSRTYTKIFTKNMVGNVMLNNILKLTNQTDLFIGDYIFDRNRPFATPSEREEQTAPSIEAELLTVQKTCKKLDHQLRIYKTLLKNSKEKIAELQNQVDVLTATLSKNNGGGYNELKINKLQNGIPFPYRLVN